MDLDNESDSAKSRYGEMYSFLPDGVSPLEMMRKSAMDFVFAMALAIAGFSGVDWLITHGVIAWLWVPLAIVSIVAGIVAFLAVITFLTILIADDT